MKYIHVQGYTHTTTNVFWIEVDFVQIQRLQSLPTKLVYTQPQPIMTPKFCVTCSSWFCVGSFYTEILSRSTVHLLTAHIKAPRYKLKISQPTRNYCRCCRKVLQQQSFLFLLRWLCLQNEKIWISSRRAPHRSTYICASFSEWQPCDVRQHIGVRSDERAAVRGETSAALPAHPQSPPQFVVLTVCSPPLTLFSCVACFSWKTSQESFKRNEQRQGTSNATHWC